jgi:cell division transport system permease protein
MFRSLGLVLTEGVADLFRYPAIALASVGSAAVALVLVGAFILTAANVGALASGVSSQVGIRLFLDRSLKPSAEARMGRRLHALPGVRQVRFISRAQALAEMRSEFSGETQVLSALGRTNPLLDSFALTFATPAQSAAAAQRLARWRGVARVIFPGEAASRLEAVLSLVRWAGGILAALLALSSFLVISNAVRLTVYGRRRELEIMLLVGATRATVRGPFLVEGMLFGLIGGAVAGLATVGGYRAVVEAVGQAAPFLPLVPAAQLDGKLVLALVGGGVVLGLLGSAFALRRMVRVAGDA